MGTKRQVGFVKATEYETAVHMQTAFLRRELTPFSERGGAVQLEDVAAVDVSFMVEMIVDRGVGGGEFLEGFDVPELRHGTLASSKWLV